MDRLHLTSRLACGAVLLAASSVCSAQLGDLMNQVKVPGMSTSDLATAALSNDEIVGGLKEALAQGTESAINSLGTKNGYFKDQAVRIAVPDQFSQVESALRMLGQEKYIRRFERSMNRAAEKAVPEAASIFGDAIREMSVDDAQRILNGPDDAATQYFRKVGEDRLTQAFRPIVSEATDKAGVTKAYKNALDKAGPAAGLLGSQVPDLDAYVTEKALDGLFLKVAEEEKRIRTNPAARSTELLEKVFGS